MSDHLDGAHSHQHILHNGESYIKLADAAETFKRLRAWHTAVSNALVEWHDPPRDDETPKDALRRLIQYEITAALDPAVSQSAADLVTTARREGVEAVNALAKLEVWAKKGKVEIARSLLGKGFEVGHLATNSVGVGETVMDAIRAAAKEGK